MDEINHEMAKDGRDVALTTLFIYKYFQYIYHDMIIVH